MNKFVKGAKNLAFALSFVTVTACGNVKKADLENLEKSLSEKIGKKADLDSCVSKKELTNINGEVEKKIGVEVQKIKTEVLTQIADDKKDVLLGVLKTDFSNLEDIVRTKGCEKLLEGVVFKGNFNKLTVEGEVDNGVFKKKFASNSGAEWDNKFFVNFVKCGGIIVIDKLDEVKFDSATTANTKIKIGGADEVDVDGLVKFLGFLKKCNLLEQAKGLNLKECFKDKRFSCITDDLAKNVSINIIKAVCDEGSFEDDKLPMAKGGVIATTFKINDVDYSWNISE